MNTSKQIIEQTEAFGANNYHPLPIVIEKAEGSWVTDPEGIRYLDMLSSYSALNQGHRHPKIIKALVEQAGLVTLTSRAFHSTVLGEWYKKICTLTKKEMVLPMNTGAEAVETAIKLARRWSYQVKQIPSNKAEIIGCNGNFHGRTMGAVSLSSEEAYKKDFGPMLEGFLTIPYGDIEALKEAITPFTAAFIVEPIQGEAGIILPPASYLQEVAAICKEHNVLLIIDEIQTGLARTGKMFAYEWENIVPDILILGKALGGGVLPISAVLADRDILGLFEPGSHGSTFGGNPLACAVSIASIDVLLDENLVARSQQLGQYFIDALRELKHPDIKEVRGRGLFIGIELHSSARPYCEALAEHRILCKETHDTVIRFAPPLTISEQDLNWAIAEITAVFNSHSL